MENTTINLNHADNTAPLDLQSAHTALTMADTEVKFRQSDGNAISRILV